MTLGLLAIEGERHIAAVSRARAAAVAVTNGMPL